MTRQSRKQKYTLTAKKYTLAAKKYTLTRNRCAHCGARFMPPYLYRRNLTATMQASERKFPENAASRGGERSFSLSSPRLLALFAEPLAAGQEPLHPNGGLRCLAQLRRRFRQGWRNVRLAGSPTGQALQESVIGAAPNPIRELSEMITLKRNKNEKSKVKS